MTNSSRGENLHCITLKGRLFSENAAKKKQGVDLAKLGDRGLYNEQKDRGVLTESASIYELAVMGPIYGGAGAGCHGHCQNLGSSSAGCY